MESVAEGRENREASLAIPPCALPGFANVPGVIRMHAIVMSTNYRNADNWMPLFRQLQLQGHRVEALWLPWAGDASAGRMSDLGLVSRVSQPIDRLDPQGLTPSELQALLERAVTPDVDVMFLCDMQSYPSHAVHGLLAQRARPPRVIGLQHGLFQSWWLYNQNFCADELLCFGARHARELLPAYRECCHAVGLPKLDMLQGLPTAEGGYILYLAQRVPEADAVTRLLQELQKEAGVPVVVRNHPQYPDLLPLATPASELVVEGVAVSALPYQRQLALANWVITPHSTGGIEALYLGKAVVLLPNHGLTAWAGYPGVATDFSVAAVLAAMQRAQQCRHEVDIFLGDAFGGLRFDSAERAAAAVSRLLESGPDWSRLPRTSVGKGALDCPTSRPETPAAGLESVAWLFRCDNRNRGIVRQNFDEAALLWQAVRATAGPILEVGRRHGGTTVLLLEASGDRPVVSIDIAPDHHAAADAVFERIKVAQPARLRLLQCDSRQRLPATQCFGMLFIDGDHSYEGVRSDTVAHWAALRAHEGREPLVVYHDAVPNQGLQHEGRINHCEGVERLCRELLAAGCAEVLGSSGSSLLLRKTAELPSSWLFEVRRGQLTRREDVVTLVPDGSVGVELGVAEGVLSERLLRRGVLSHLYSVDMYAGDRGHDVLQYRRALQKLAPFRHANTLIKMRFDEALDLFMDSSLDFIYVDGYAHTGEEQGQTFFDWYPKLRPGGVIAGDDYCAEWPLVVEAVDRFLASHELPLHVIDCREEVAYCKYPTWYTRKPD